MNLARLDENRRVLGQEGACQAAYHAIAHFMKDGGHHCDEDHPRGLIVGRKAESGFLFKNRLGGQHKQHDVIGGEDNEQEDHKIVLYGVWALIALSSASDENKRILNKIDARSLLLKLQQNTPPEDGFFSSKIKIALDRLQTRLLILT
jgi:hypothetical protein